MQHLQWFPGHMTAAMRMMEENLKAVDGVLAVLDARAAEASVNAKLEKLFNEVEPITAIPSSEEYVSGQREIYGWYTSLGIIQGKTKDDKPVTIRMDVALAYRNGDTETPKEIQKRTVEIKDFLKRYISEKEAKDFRNTNNEDQLEEEIKNGINEKILSSGRIRDVVFQQKDVIE